MWAVHLTPLEHVLRWMVVGLGITIMLEFILAAIVSPASRRPVGLMIVKIASGAIILGITLNYSLSVPIVMPGALLYLGAYMLLLGEICVLIRRRRNARGKRRDGDGF